MATNMIPNWGEIIKSKKAVRTSDQQPCGNIIAESADNITISQGALKLFKKRGKHIRYYFICTYRDDFSIYTIISKIIHVWFWNAFSKRLFTTNKEEKMMK
jgi:hypothetical protein